MKQTMFVPWLAESLNKKNKFVNRSANKSQKEGRLISRITAIKNNVEPVNDPIDLIFSPVLSKKSRAFDCINYAPTCKAIEDGLVDAGILKNDSNKYVRSITIEAPTRGILNGCYVTIEKH